MKVMITALFSLMATILATASTAEACRGIECPLYVRVSVAEQLMYVYIDGKPTSAHQVSTGLDGYSTPSFEGRPNGRIYDAYTSKKFPGGNYIDERGRSLGNMPYAMFFKGGYAIHGTPTGNFRNLGRQASHGCIRMYPEQALEINRMVRKLGVSNVWFSIDRNPIGMN